MPFWRPAGNSPFYGLAADFSGGNRRFFFEPEVRHDGQAQTRYNTVMSNQNPGKTLNRRRYCLYGLGACLALTSLTATAEPTIRNDIRKNSSPAVGQEPPKLPAPKGVKAMPKPHRVWIDAKKKQVLVDGYVSLNEGLLENVCLPVGHQRARVGRGGLQ